VKTFVAFVVLLVPGVAVGQSPSASVPFPKGKFPQPNFISAVDAVNETVRLFPKETTVAIEWLIGHEPTFKDVYRIDVNKAYKELEISIGYHVIDEGQRNPGQRMKFKVDPQDLKIWFVHRVRVKPLSVWTLEAHRAAEIVGRVSV
jgi:hypothetical protein